MTPFLTVLTRHMATRPGMLAANRESLECQDCQDFEQVLILDDVGQGVVWANAQLAEQGPRIHGDYVLVLDDDDVLTDGGVVALLKRTAQGWPGVIAFKVDHGLPLGVLPDAGTFGNFPVFRHMGGSSVCVRRDVWSRNCHAWASGRYEADFDFLHSVWGEGPRVAWLNRVLVTVRRISKGACE